MNKLNESGNVIMNKARLVTQCYTQIEGINFEETFALVAWLKVIWMTLALASFKDLKFFQMEVKNKFFEWFYRRGGVCWTTPDFVDPTHPNFIFKLQKILYRLKQAPRAWYERLSNFLVENDFVKGKVDTTFFTKHVDNDILIVQIYVDIIFGSTNENFVRILNYAWRWSSKWVWWGLNYFLGLQIKHKSDEIFVNQAKYTRDLIKKFGLEDAKINKTLMATTTKLEKDKQGKVLTLNSIVA